MPHAIGPFAIVLLLSAPPVAAQVLPVPLQNRPFVTTGDIHRYEMDRVRSQADQSQALARSQAVQSQLTIQQLQTRRQPPLTVTEPAPSSAVTLEQAQQARRASEARTGTATRSTHQIDSWLDRGPR